jgi:hypothetical protein
LSLLLLGLALAAGALVIAITDDAGAAFIAGMATVLGYVLARVTSGRRW